MLRIFSLYKELFLNKFRARTHEPRGHSTSSLRHLPPSPGPAAAPPHLDDAFTIQIIETLGVASDLIKRTVMVGPHQVSMLYLDGMVNSLLVSECIVRPMTESAWVHEAASSQDLLDRLDWGGIHSAAQKRHTCPETIVNEILTGSVALVFNRQRTALTFDCKGFDKRGVSTPTEEHTLKGAKDCFVETMRVNTATLRRKICSPDLSIENYTLGQDTQTMTALVYVRGRVNPDLLAAIKQRLDTARLDDLLSLSALESQLVDGRLSPFPQILYTEKPDRFCAGILDGRVGLIVDGIPFVMILPYSFFDFFRVPTDYNYKYLPARFYRLMRFALFFITLFLPGLFVALCNFHPEMLPSDLAASIAKSRQGVPLPAFLEMTLILLAFHGLIQAGLGSWTSIGGTVSIVGALVLGDAAISARFLSPSILVVVAITGICTISLQNFELLFATVIWQFLILMASSFYGLLGTLFAGLLLLYSLSCMETLGTPYLQPFEATLKADSGWFPPSIAQITRKLRAYPVNTLRLKTKPPKR